MKKRILLVIIYALIIIACIGIGHGISYYNNNDNSKNNKAVVEEETNNNEENEVIITDEVLDLVKDTQEVVENGEDLSTTEILANEEANEEILEEERLESDAQVEQENIAWEGNITGNGLSLLGAYQGLTYYSQADSRWANVMYSSIGDTTQTMSSSACGPTAGAIVVSSSKGVILPTTMADLAVSNGYRTASNGTAWSYFSFIADYFDFNEYYETSSFATATNYLKKDNNNNGVADYYVVVSCGSGLFTTGGHYIVLVADTDGTLTVYDPYLYDGKFDTASRKSAGVVVSGNNVYVTESSFKTYANARNYWIFSNDEGEGNTNSSSTTSVSYTRYVATKSANLNVRSGAGTSYSIIGSLAKGTKVKVTKINGSWSYITSPTTGWVSSEYLSSSKVTSTSSTYSTTVGSYYRLKSATTLYSNGDLTGTKYNYLAQTQIKVISHYNSNVDYILCTKTGRYAYCSVSAFTTSSNSYSTTIGNYYRMTQNANLYGNGNLTGTKYNYLAQTQVKVLSHYNSSVDYVQCVKTGRKAYIESKYIK